MEKIDGMNKPLVVGDVWSWTGGGLNHCCQVVGGLSIWSALNTLKDSMEIFAGEYAVDLIEKGVGGASEDARFNSNFIQYTLL